jgi:hypothetical protein
MTTSTCSKRFKRTSSGHERKSHLAGRIALEISNPEASQAGSRTLHRRPGYSVAWTPISRARFVDGPIMITTERAFTTSSRGISMFAAVHCASHPGLARGSAGAIRSNEHQLSASPVRASAIAPSSARPAATSSCDEAAAGFATNVVLRPKSHRTSALFPVRWTNSLTGATQPSTKLIGSFAAHPTRTPARPQSRTTRLFMVPIIGEPTEHSARIDVVPPRGSHPEAISRGANPSSARRYASRPSGENLACPS